MSDLYEPNYTALLKKTDVDESTEHVMFLDRRLVTNILPKVVYEHNKFSHVKNLYKFLMKFINWLKS